MSVLSITAPQFTAEDEQLERDNVTQEEMDAALHDIYGTGTLEETEEMRIRGPIELEAALQDIPMEEKEAYLEAVARVPEIVEAESNFLLFLRSEDYNVWVRTYIVGTHGLPLNNPCVLLVVWQGIPHRSRAILVFHFCLVIFSHSFSSWTTDCIVSCRRRPNDW
jgi:hypothetical protein